MAAVEEPPTASSPHASTRVVTQDQHVLQPLADVVSTLVDATFELRLDARDQRIRQALYVATRICFTHHDVSDGSDSAHLCEQRCVREEEVSVEEWPLVYVEELLTIVSVEW